MSEIECAYCTSLLEFYKDNDPAPGWRHHCLNCGMESNWFDTRAAAEAHARGHLEAMLERLPKNVPLSVRRVFRDGQWIWRASWEGNDMTLHTHLGPIPRAAVEAALKEAERKEEG